MKISNFQDYNIIHLYYSRPLSLWFDSHGKGFPSGSAVKNLPPNAGDEGSSTGQEDPLEKWQAAPTFLSGKSSGQRSLAGYRPWGHKEADMTEQLNKNNSKP